MKNTIPLGSRKAGFLVLVLAFIIDLIPGVAKAKLVACVGGSSGF